MKRIALGLLILGALVSALMALGASWANSHASSGAGLAAGFGTNILYSLKLVDPNPDLSAAGSLGPGEASAGTGLPTGETPAEGYELTIAYRDSAGNEFTLIKPMDNEPASIQAKVSQGFWQRKLEPLLRSIGALFTISVER